MAQAGLSGTLAGSSHSDLAPPKVLLSTPRLPKPVVVTLSPVPPFLFLANRWVKLALNKSAEWR